MTFTQTSVLPFCGNAKPKIFTLTSVSPRKSATENTRTTVSQETLAAIKINQFLLQAKVAALSLGFFFFF